MSGSLHAFSVELDRDAVVSLVKKATLDITGSGISTEDEVEFRSSLETLSLEGTIAFDPKDAHVMDMQLTVAQSGTLIGNISFFTSTPRTVFNLTSVEDGTNISLLLTSENDRDDMKLVLTQS